MIGTATHSLLVWLDLLFSFKTLVKWLCDVIFASFKNNINTFSINILNALRFTGYLLLLNILGAQPNTFSRISFITVPTIKILILPIWCHLMEDKNLWIIQCYATIPCYGSNAKYVSLTCINSKPLSVFKGNFFRLGHRCLHVGWFCWYHLKNSYVDNLSFDNYTNSLIIDNMITMPIILLTFIFRNDI